MSHTTRRMPRWFAGLLIASAGMAATSRGAILNWETGQVIPGTAAITPGPGVNLSGWNTPGHTLAFADLTSKNLTNASFQGSDLSAALLDASTLTNANLAGANLTASRSSDAVFIGANLSNANLREASLVAAILTGANLSNANLTRVDFGGADVANANFTGAVIKGADLRSYFTSTTGFTSAQLYSTASYIDRDLSGLKLGNGFSKSGWNFANQNLSDAYLDGNMTGANFSEANLTHAVLNDASLANANFADANLTDADIRSIDLTDTNFTNANLTRARIGGTNMGKANLTGTIIQGAALTSPELTSVQLASTASYAKHDLSGVRFPQSFNLSGFDLSHQNLTGAVVRNVILTNANFTGAVIKGVDFGSTAVPGFTRAQLETTASYANRDLSGISFPSFNAAGINLANQNLTDVRFGSANFPDANFTHANLTRATFTSTTITNSDFTGAVITGTDFTGVRGFHVNQIYGTASYALKDLSGVGLRGLNLATIILSHQDLTGALFSGANLADAVFTGADLRGATGWTPVASTITHNTIRTDGTIQGLSLLAGEMLLVRNHNLPVRVQTSAAFHPTSKLQFLLEDGWTSPVRFADGMTVPLGGTLSLNFAAGVDPDDLMGQTFKIFDWTGVQPTGAFSIASPYSWDLSRLYTTGEVTLVPEPATLTIVLAGPLGFGFARWSAGRRARRRQATSA